MSVSPGTGSSRRLRSMKVRASGGSAWEIKSHLTIAVWVVAPVPAHLHEQEEMHLLLEDPGELLAGRLADRLQRLAAMPEHDRFLAVALDIDHLLDPDRAVLAL